MFFLYFLRLFFTLCCFTSFVHADALETILTTKKIRVCIWSEYYGISYIDPRTQELIGLDVDLAKEFAKHLNVSIAFQQSSFATLINDIKTNRCDLAAFAIAHTPQRQEHLYLSSPHLQSDIYAITTKHNQRIKTWDDIDKEGVIVAVAKGTLHVKIMQERLKKAQLLILDSLHAREREVESGRADLFMTDYPFGMRMLEQKEWAKLIRPETPFHMSPYGWAMAQDEKALHEKVEAFLQMVKEDGMLLFLAKKHRLDPIVSHKQ